MDYTIDEAVIRFIETIDTQFAFQEVYLYGSYAKGTANSDSDIDIAIVIKPVDNRSYMDFFSKLFVYAAAIDSRIEPNLLIDDGDDDEFSFLSEVRETGKRINI